MSEELIENQRFASVKIGSRLHWIAIHEEEKHFNDNSRPQIKVCGRTLRIRANHMFTCLPKCIKSAMVAHELGHLEYQHHLELANPFYRYGMTVQGKVSEREYQADRYAVKLIGKEKYVKALCDYIVATQSQGIGKQELEMRIRKLNKEKS